MKKTFDELQQIRRQALGLEDADLVIKNVTILNVITGSQKKGDIAICGDRIVGVYDSYKGKVEIDGTGLFAAPGFINRHVHIDSGTLNPYEFDRLVLPRGTTTAFWCPHEIVNVKGHEGMKYALDCADHTVMTLKVQISSSVPALKTDMETAGAEINAADMLRYKNHPRAYGTGEHMSTGDIIEGDPDAIQKLTDWQDGFLSGHMPLESKHRPSTLRALGIRDCHESSSYEEGSEKLEKGVAVLIREGTQCKNLRDLFRLVNDKTADNLGLCTDDRKPNDIVNEGDIDFMVRSLIEKGVPVATAYRVASLSGARNAEIHDLGAIAPGYQADILLLDNLEKVSVFKVIKNGRLVTPESFASRHVIPGIGYNSVKLLRDVRADDFALKGAAGEPIGVIGLIPDQIVTNYLREGLAVDGKGVLQADLSRDILKIAVLERHGRTANGNIGVSFVKGFGFKGGAVASTVSHDAHNLVVIGADDADMALAANRAKEIGGGFVVARGGKILGEMALPIGGLMVDHGTPYEQVVGDLETLYKAVAKLEPTMDPSKVFLAASFAPLGVIPAAGISDFGPIRYDVLNGDVKPVLVRDQRSELGLGPRPG